MADMTCLNELKHTGFSSAQLNSLSQVTESAKDEITVTVRAEEARVAVPDLGLVESLAERRHAGPTLSVCSDRINDLASVLARRWSLAVIPHRMVSGDPIEILAVLDDCDRKCLSLLASTSISGPRVANRLKRAADQYGSPAEVVSDAGTVMTSASSSWAAHSDVRWLFYAHWNPQQMGWPEALERRLKNALLQKDPLCSISRARSVLEAWRLRYNSQLQLP